MPAGTSSAGPLVSGQTTPSEKDLGTRADDGACSPGVPSRPPYALVSRSGSVGHNRNIFSTSSTPRVTTTGRTTPVSGMAVGRPVAQVQCRTPRGAPATSVTATPRCRVQQARSASANSRHPSQAPMSASSTVASTCTSTPAHERREGSGSATRSSSCFSAPTLNRALTPVRTGTVKVVRARPGDASPSPAARPVVRHAASPAPAVQAIAHRQGAATLMTQPAVRTGSQTPLMRPVVHRPGTMSPLPLARPATMPCPAAVQKDAPPAYPVQSMDSPRSPRQRSTPTAKQPEVSPGSSPRVPHSSPPPVNGVSSPRQPPQELSPGAVLRQALILPASSARMSPPTSSPPTAFMVAPPMLSALPASATSMTPRSISPGVAQRGGLASEAVQLLSPRLHSTPVAIIVPPLPLAEASQSQGTEPRTASPSPRGAMSPRVAVLAPSSQCRSRSQSHSPSPSPVPSSSRMTNRLTSHEVGTRGRSAEVHPVPTDSFSPPWPMRLVQAPDDKKAPVDSKLHDIETATPQRIPRFDLGLANTSTPSNFTPPTPAVIPTITPTALLPDATVKTVKVCPPPAAPVISTAVLTSAPPPVHMTAVRERTSLSAAAKAAASTTSATDDALFQLFSSALADPSTADSACRRLLAQFLGPDVAVQWGDLEGLDPVETLTRAVGGNSSEIDEILQRRRQYDTSSGICISWWRALLARHGLYGGGDAVGAEEFGELMVSAFRTLRDRHAPEEFLRGLRAVPRAAPRLKDRYTDFEFVSRGALGKTYRCRSLLTREERVCRQVRKDWVMAPADQLRSEIALLRNIEHQHLPRVVESFEDFNSVYIIVDLVEGIELMGWLQQQHVKAVCLSEAWVASVMRQTLKALRYCHELRPHSIVHGDLRLDSLVLASSSDPGMAPHVVVADLGLAGLLPPSPPRCRSSSMEHPEISAAALKPSYWIQCVSPKLDVWSCGCILFILLSGHQPLGDDVAGPLLPSREPDWELLQHVSNKAWSLCRRMLTWDPWLRAGTSECLQHPWLTASENFEYPDLQLEALGALVQAHARSKFRQVVTNRIVSELGTGPFACLSSLAVQQLGAPPEPRQLLDLGDSASPESCADALTQLGVCGTSVKQVIRAFDIQSDNRISYSRFIAGCANLAEDRLDHALWRVFTAVGEDHRGVLSAAALEHVLDGAAGADTGVEGVLSDAVGGAERYIRSALDPELTASEIARHITCGGKEVTFEALKSFVIRRQGLRPESFLAGAKGAEGSFRQARLQGLAAAAESSFKAQEASGEDV